MRSILLIDNYDSFSYNLYHFLEAENVRVVVKKNDEIAIPEVFEYDALVLSPGPGLPGEAGKLMEALELCSGTIPVLGVCLGMQAMALHLGGEIYNQESVRHGEQEEVNLSDSQLFNGLPDRIQVGLYHSWAVLEGRGDFVVTARSTSGVTMAIENSALQLYGVQFHPESVMTPQGKQIVRNFLSIV